MSFSGSEKIFIGMAEKVSVILIDEFQDINKIQFDIVKMLAAPENNLFVVGDDDQSIYRFRGARPELMLHFKDDLSGGRADFTGYQLPFTKRDRGGITPSDRM